MPEDTLDYFRYPKAAKVAVSNLLVLFNFLWQQIKAALVSAHIFTECFSPLELSCKPYIKRMVLMKVADKGG